MGPRPGCWLGNQGAGQECLPCTLLCWGHTAPLPTGRTAATGQCQHKAAGRAPRAASICSFPLHPLQELGFLCLFIHLVSTASPFADPFKVPGNIQEKRIGLLCLPFCSELTVVMLCSCGSGHSQLGLQHSCVANRRGESRGQTRLSGYPASG